MIDDANKYKITQIIMTMMMKMWGKKKKVLRLLIDSHVCYLIMVSVYIPPGTPLV